MVGRKGKEEEGGTGWQAEEIQSNARRKQSKGERSDRQALQIVLSDSQRVLKQNTATGNSNVQLYRQVQQKGNEAGE